MADNLTPEQKQFVTSPVHSSSSLIACAGSGKSYALVHRIGYLMDNGVEPEKILVIMFNDSAVQNFREDLDQIDYMVVPGVKTFHSYSRGLCNILIEHGFLKKADLITSQSTYRKFYKDVLAGMIPAELSETYTPARLLEQFITYVELIKSSLKSPEEVFEQGKYADDKRFYIGAFKHSEESRKFNNAQFFSDLIYDVITTCKAEPKALRCLTGKYDVVLVDEFQDANHSSYKLLKIAAGNNARVNVCGDPNQNIYNFIGASSRFLTEDIFNDFAPVSRFYLTRTFRYGHSVALLSNNLIQKNSNESRLCISARNDFHTHIALLRYQPSVTDCEQTAFVDHIRQWIVDGGKFSDIAVLIRNYSNTFPLELACLSRGIPYFISKENASVVYSNECEFLCSALICLGQIKDNNFSSFSEAIYSVLTFCARGLSGQIAGVLISLIKHEEIEQAIEFLRSKRLKMRKPVYDQIIRRLKAFSVAIELRDKLTFDELLSSFLESAKITLSVANANKQNSLQAVQRFERLTGFLLNQGTTAEQIIDKVVHFRAEQDDGDREHKVEFTTLHRSKGLAWPFVILGFLEECICPAEEASDPDLLEAERRLLYVGMTRARQKLGLHTPKGRFLERSIAGYRDTINPADLFEPHTPSRFLFESNILSATTLGYDIFAKRNTSSISKSDNRHLYNEYLNELNLPFRISGLSANDQL